MPITLKSGSLNLLEPSGPVQTCNGSSLTFYCQCSLFSIKYPIILIFFMSGGLAILINPDKRSSVVIISLLVTVTTIWPFWSSGTVFLCTTYVPRYLLFLNVFCRRNIKRKFVRYERGFSTSCTGNLWPAEGSCEVRVFWTDKESATKRDCPACVEICVSNSECRHAVRCV
jgi:hypothetical protein